MRTMNRRATIRLAIVGGVAAALTWASRTTRKSASAQQAEPYLIAMQVPQVPTDPGDSAWAQAKTTTVTMSPQNIVLPRLKEAGAKSINVKALYDAERLSLLLEWLDAHKDADLGTVLQYRDAMAVQLPEDSDTPPPSFTMGQAGRAVTIYHWKSDWQFNRLFDVDEAYPNMYADWYQFSGVPAGGMPEAVDYLTKGKKEYLTAAAVGNALADPLIQVKIGPVQKMRAEGFGTIEPAQSQDGAGKGTYESGGWRIVISLPRQQSKYRLEEGALASLAFAVWDGSRKERNGQKAYSLWNTMSLGQPITETQPGGGLSLPAVGGIAGIVVAIVAALVGLRVWRSRRQQTQSKREV
ncbi:MAG: hypothetical protein HY666_06180 [Chloroflexi bacterium]|nr:hypothetical protein [Chloroflexota bacterium]